MNHRQQTILVAAAAACITVLAVHNPFGGYANTEHVQAGKIDFTQEWQHSRPGCTDARRVEMDRLTAEIEAEFARKAQVEGVTNRLMMEQMAAKNGGPGRIFQACVKVTQVSGSDLVESEPPWRWISVGAFLPFAAPMKNVLLALASIALWTAVLLFATRVSRPGKSMDGVERRNEDGARSQ